MASRFGFKLTGVSCPVFGVSWTPTDSDRKIVQDVFRFLEDRRVLYNPFQLEVEYQVVQSVLEIRKELTRTLTKFPTGSDTAHALRAMRAACRKFLDNCHSGPTIMYGRHGEPLFLQLGELRNAFGLQLARLAVMYGVEDSEIEPELLTIFPPDDEESKAE
jgi:hypothetical protein